jgi:hypothetical protein
VDGDVRREVAASLERPGCLGRAVLAFIKEKR